MLHTSDPTPVDSAQPGSADRPAQPAARPGKAGRGALADAQQLVKELQLHQEELHAQHEELQAAHAATEAALVQAEALRERMAELYEFAPTALFALNADGAIAQLNDRASRMLGTTPSRLTGRRFLLVVSPESREPFLAFFDTVLGSRQRHTLELHLQTMAGARFVANVEGVAGVSATGATTVQLAVMDVTALNVEVERRRRSEERLELALAASNTGVWVWAFATNALEWDARAQACFGRPHDPNPTSFAVLQAAVYAPDVLPLQRALQAAIKRGQALDIEFRVQWPDGTVHYLGAHGKVQLDAQHQPESFIGLVHDVTTRRMSEEELDYQRRQFQMLLANLPMLYVRLSPAGEYLEATGAGLQRLNLTDNELVGLSLYKSFPSISEPVRRVLAGEKVSFTGTSEVAGEPVYFRNYGFFDEQRQQGVLFAIDVTESEAAKHRLRAEQEFTKSLLNHYVDGVAAFDQDGRITAWNRVMESLTGWAEVEALGQDVFDRLPFERQSLPGHIVAHLRDGARRPRFHQPFSLDTPSRDFELTAVPLPHANGAGNAGGLLMLRDVTERNRLHASAAQFKQQQQRETFRMVLMAQEVERKRIAEALHNGVGQLLYATKLHLEEAPTNPAIAAEALALLEEAIKATRNVSFELTPSILEDFGLATALQKLAKSIPGDKLRLHLYLTGLERPLPKVLTVAIYRMVQELVNNVVKHARATEATLHVAYEGDHVHISMEDDGGGFDVPTTVGSAKGIGLASLYNRAALLGGEFELFSRPGRGTIATITLPVISEELEPLGRVADQ